MATALSISPHHSSVPVMGIAPKSQGKAGRMGLYEIRFLISFIVSVAVLTTTPHLVGYFQSAPGTVLTGALNHSLDNNNYLAYVHQAASGKWLFRNPMTPEPHAAVFFNLEWLAAGKISAVLHLSLSRAVEVERLLCLGIISFAVYWLAASLFSSLLVRRLALISVMAGGGIGWIAAIHVLHVPLDSSYFLDLTNGNLFPFYWALKLPHFLVSESFVVLGLALFLNGECHRQVRNYAGAGLSFMAAGACRPYDMLYVMAAISLFVAISFWKHSDSRSSIVLRLLPVAMCTPLLVYYFWIFKLHPVFHWWSFPGNPAPAPWLLGAGFGPSFFFFLYSLRKLLSRASDPRCLFMMSCLLTAIVLSYAHHWLHFAFQFATNILLPMVMLAFFALEPKIVQWSNRVRWSSLAIIALLAGNSLTSVALTAQAAWLARKGDFRIDANLVNSFRWLDAHSRRDDVILADFENSNLIPQYTHSVVFCGYINAVNFDEKLKQIREFLSPASSDNFRISLLHRYNIRFVLLTADERGQLPEITNLTEVYRNRAAVVLAVTGNQQPTILNPGVKLNQNVGKSQL